MSKTPKETDPQRDAKGDLMTDSTLDVTKRSEERRRPAVDAAPIDWKAVASTVGGCWTIFGLTTFLGSAVHVAPVALLTAGVLCWVLGVSFGPGHELEIIFVYWTLVGAWLSWRMHKSTGPAIDVISRGLMLHLVVNLVAWFPTAVLVFGR